MSSEQAQSVKPINLGGDTTIVVGLEDCPARLRVSRALLSIVSPYFCALFGANFREGAVAQAGEEVRLHDDDAEAVTDLLKVLHMRYTGPRPMPPVKLFRLAVVADKYRCVEAINLSATGLFPDRSEWMEQRNSSTCELLVAAYLLDQANLFSALTRTLVLWSSVSFMQLAQSEVGQKVPLTVWLRLEGARAEAFRMLHIALARLLRKPCPTGLKKCNASAIWYDSVLDSMTAEGICALDAMQDTPMDLLSKMRRIEVPVFGPRKCGRFVNATLPHPKPLSKNDFNTLIDNAQSSVKGLDLKTLSTD